MSDLSPLACCFLSGKNKFIIKIETVNHRSQINKFVHSLKQLASHGTNHSIA